MSAAASRRVSFEEVLGLLDGVTRSSKEQAGARCPAHVDRRQSLTVGERDKGIVFHCHAGCPFEDIVAALGLKPEQLFFGDKPRPKAKGARSSKIVARYVYTDSSGTPTVRVNRTADKRFWQEHHDGNGWLKGLASAERGQLYNLTEVERAVMAGEEIFIVEGEKDVEALSEHGVAATCNLGGAGKWNEENGARFAGARVTLVPDRDRAGYRHAAAVLASIEPHAAEVRVVEAADGKDVSDHLDAGNALGALVPTELPAPDERPAQLGVIEVVGAVDDKAATGRPDDFWGAHGLIVPALAEAARGGQLVKLGHDGRLYIYAGGAYRADDGTLAARARELLGDRFRANHLREVMAWFHANVPSISAEPPEEFINCANGLLEWRTGELHAHDPEFPTTVQIPVAWNADAAASVWPRFIETVLPGMRAFIEELLGYALYAGNPFRKAVLALGSGHNGKSTLLRVFEALLGASNWSAVELQMLAENRFAAAEVYGKLANICADIDARAIKRTSVFKMITGGDPIPAERKYGAFFTFTSFALPIFSANEPPLVSDQSEAWFRRWIVLPFEQEFAEDRGDVGVKADPTLKGRLTEPRELEGVLVLAVAGLQRLMARGGFELPAKAVWAAQQYRDRLDSAREFVGDECEVGVEKWVQKSVLYREYKRWCQDNGRLAVSSHNFNDHIRRALGDRVVEKQVRAGGKNQGKCWRGITLRRGPR